LAFAQRRGTASGDQHTREDSDGQHTRTFHGSRA
jgi:hypothetical protein